MTSHLYTMFITCILMCVLCLIFTASVSEIEMGKSPFGPLMCDRLCHYTVGCVFFFYAPQDLTCYLGNASTSLDREPLQMTVSKVEGNTFTDISKCSRNSKTYQSRSKKLICFKQNERGNTISTLKNYGAACNATSDCHEASNTCTEGVCQCQTGYKYSTQTWSCYQYYYGCYEDKRVRMLPFNAMTLTYTLTIDLCVTHCRGLGYNFAGAQNGAECSCGRHIILRGYKKYGKKRCNKRCPGNHIQKCGGYRKQLIYSTRR